MVGEVTNSPAGAEPSAAAAGTSTGAPSTSQPSSTSQSDPTPGSPPTQTTQTDTKPAPSKAGVEANVPDYKALGLDLDDFDLGIPKPTEQVPAAAVVPPVVQPVQTQGQPQSQLVQPPPAASAPAQVQPVETVTSPAQPQAEPAPATVDSVLSEWAPNRQKIFDQLAPTFKLTDEQVEALQADPVAETPKLLAHTYMRAVETALTYTKALVTDRLPQIIAAEVAKATKGREIEDQFFTKYPQLDRVKHAADIHLAGNLVKAQFQQAGQRPTPEVLMANIAAFVAMKNGFVLTAPSGAPSQQVQPTAFVPAQNGAGIVAQQPIASSGFEGMGRNFDNA